MKDFPVFGDQPYNAKRAEYHGFAETLDVQTFTAKQLQGIIQKMLKDGSYARKIKRASGIFRSQPMPPRDRAAYWIGHVLKFGGSHLRSAAFDLSWWEYVMADVVVFLLLLLVAALWITVSTVLLCTRRCRRVLAELSATHNNNDIVPFKRTAKSFPLFKDSFFSALISATNQPKKYFLFS